MRPDISRGLQSYSQYLENQNGYIIVSETHGRRHKAAVQLDVEHVALVDTVGDLPLGQQADVEGLQEMRQRFLGKIDILTIYLMESTRSGQTSMGGKVTLDSS